MTIVHLTGIDSGLQARNKINQAIDKANLVDSKVDKETGKGLSTNDYDNTAKGVVDAVPGNLSNKVDKVEGKQLSTNDYTTTEKEKLGLIEAEANKYQHPTTHPPAIIEQDINNRFASDAEKTFWNAKAEDIESLDYVPEAPHDSGAVTSGTISSLTDSTKDWEPNEWVDKVVRVWFDGVQEFGVVLSNTETELVFDCDLLFAIDNTMQYEILDTLVLTAEKNKIVALDVRVHYCGVLLPKVTPELERKWLHIYIEKSANGNQVPVVTRCNDSVLGQRWATLNHQAEGFRLYVHNFLITHWDMLNQFNIKRYACFSFTEDVVVDSTSFIEVSDKLAVTDETVFKRFVFYDNGDGQKRIKYISIFPSVHQINIPVQVDKTGGGAGELSFAVRRYRGAVVKDFPAKTSRFGAGEGRQSIVFLSGIDLEFGDELVFIASRTAGNFVIGSETSGIINEL